jgi:hypothetical protein
MPRPLIRRLWAGALGLCVALSIAPPVAGQHFSDCFSTTTNATLLVPDDVSASLGSSGDGLGDGDEIALFTGDGQCVGVGTWQQANLAIAIAGANSQESTGYEDGQSLRFRIWDASAQVTYEPDASFASCPDGNPLCKSDGLYEADAFYALASLAADSDPPDDGGDPPAETVEVADITANQYPDVVDHTLDGDLATRWGARGLGASIEYELASEATLDQVGIAWYRGNQRQTHFEIALSTDGVNWTTVHDGSSSGSSLQLEPYSFSATAARHVRVTGFGNTQNTWISMTEIDIRGTASDGGDPPDDGGDPPAETIEVVDITANQYPDVVDHTLDGDLATRWGTSMQNDWIEYELSAESSLDQLGIAWYRGDKRQTHFEVALSTDGTTWTTVHDGSSSGATMGLEYYSFTSTPARHVRITGFGNTENTWTSITEVTFDEPDGGSSPAMKRVIDQPIEEVVKELALDPSYPNPFGVAATIEYALPEPAHVVLEVFDLLGRRVARLVDQERSAGRHRVRVDAGDWTSGTYLYRLRAGGETRTGRMTVVR